MFFRSSFCILISMILVACGGAENSESTTTSSSLSTSSQLSTSAIGATLSSVAVNKAEASSLTSSTLSIDSVISSASSISRTSSSSFSSKSMGSFSSVTYSSSSNTSSSSFYGRQCGWSLLAEGSEYVSFESKAAADSAGAKIVMSGSDCGVIAGKQTHKNNPITIVNETFLSGLAAAPLIGNVKIDGNLLQIELTYAACQETKLDLVVSHALRTSYPLQAAYVFQGNTGNCDTLFTSTFTYDLSPLQLIYSAPEPNSKGEIVLQGIGSYIFARSASGAASSSVSNVSTVSASSVSSAAPSLSSASSISRTSSSSFSSKSMSSFSSVTYSSSSNTSSSSFYGRQCGWSLLAEGSEYVSFESKAAADAVGAKIVKSGSDCGVIAGKQTHKNNPITIVNETFLSGLATAPIIGNVKIDGNLLQIELTYAACQETKLDLVVSHALRTSLPVQAAYVFQGNTGNCDTLFTSTFTYDLSPLQLIYSAPEPNSKGEIVLQGIGSYIFARSASSAASSSVSNVSKASFCGWNLLAEGSEYVNFDSKIAADTAGARIVLSGFGCGRIVGKQVHQYQPITIVNETFPSGLAVAPVIDNVKIDGNLLQVKLTYAACQETKLGMVASNALRASSPVQAAYVFVGDTGNCGNLFTSTFTYDLSPLQLIYSENPYNPTREIVLQGLGSYRF